MTQLIIFVFILSISPFQSFTSSSFSQPTQTRSEEWQILGQFYKQTSLTSHWKNSTGWLDAFSDYCEWFGITCNSEGRVNKIVLSKNGLSGKFPDILCKLERLESLDLSMNSLEGIIDFQFDQKKKKRNGELIFCQELKYLNLSSNILTGLEEKSLQRVPKLEALNVSLNYLEKVPDYFLNGSSESIKVIDLSQSQIEMVSNKFPKFPNIEYFDFSRNFISKSSKNNSMEGKFSLFWEMNNLRVLKLSRTGFKDSEFPNSLAKFTNLKELDLSGNSITNLSESVTNCQSLEILNLNNNEFLLHISPSINELKNLKELKIKYCGINSLPKFEIPLESLEVEENTNLEELNLEGLEESLNSLSFSLIKLVPSSLESFSNLESLQILGSSPSFELKDSDFLLPPNLKRILLSSLPFSEWPKSWINHEKKALELFYLIVQDELLEFPEFLFDSAENLIHISLNGNLIGTIPTSIGDLQKLEELSIISTLIDGNIPTQIGLIENLQVLEIVDNRNMIGVVPKELINLTNLKVLEVVGNSFESKLDLELMKFNEKTVCTFQQQNPFECDQTQLIGDFQVCNVNCEGNTLAGIWMNEIRRNESCFISPKTGMTFDQVKFDIESDGKTIVVIDNYIDCSQKTFEFILKGQFSIISKSNNCTQECEIVFEFVLKEVNLLVLSFQFSDSLKILCGWDITQNQIVDISSWYCNETFLQYSYNFPPVSSCLPIVDKAYINFKNSTLMLGNNFFTNYCQTLPPSPIFTSLKLRRNWECKGEESMICIPKCGDGFSFGREPCDGSPNEGCTEFCQIEEGWKCIIDENAKSICFKIDQSNFLPWYIYFASTLFIIIVITIIMVIIIGWRKMKHISEFTIDENELELNELLGCGNFGQVYKGMWRGTTQVAIKLLKQNELETSNESLKEFQKETLLYSNLRPHPNIVQFLGIKISHLSSQSRSSKTLLMNRELYFQTSGKSQLKEETNIEELEEFERETKFQLPNLKGQTLIVTEFLEGGNLMGFMRNSHDNWVYINSNKEYCEIVDICLGVSAGMDHLHRNNIIHRDLAARNILISKVSNPIPKISDFGLSNSISKNIKLPVRWTSPEVLLNSNSSSFSSDVWSFGIVLWEISTTCKIVPYPTLVKNNEVIEFVLDGGVLQMIELAPSGFVSTFKSCLSFIPSLRPTFSLLFNIFSNEKKKLQNIQSETTFNNFNHTFLPTEQNEKTIYSSCE